MNQKTYKRIHDQLAKLDTFIILVDNRDSANWAEIQRRVKKLPPFMGIVNKDFHQKITVLKAFVNGNLPADFEKWQIAKRKIGELRDFAFDCYIESKTIHEASPKTSPENTPTDALDACKRFKSDLG